MCALIFSVSAGICTGDWVVGWDAQTHSTDTFKQACRFITTSERVTTEIQEPLMLNSQRV